MNRNSARQVFDRMILASRDFFLELNVGGVVSHCNWGLPEFWWNFWRSGDMNFTKFYKSGSNLQRVKFEKFEKEKSGS